MNKLIMTWAAMAATATTETRFGADAPSQWWMDCPVPEQCLIETIFDLPTADQLEQKVNASLSIGPDGDSDEHSIYAWAEFEKTKYSAGIRGLDANENPSQSEVSGDTRPSVLRAWEEAEDHPGWAGKTVSLSLTLGAGSCRLLINGSQVAQVAAAAPSDRRLAVRAQGITLRAVRVLPNIDDRYAFLSGAGFAMSNGGETSTPANGMPAQAMESVLLHIDDVPLLVNSAGMDALTTIAVKAERWKAGTWSEGTGMLTANVPPDSYSSAYVLIHRPRDSADDTAAMGFGLRVPEMSAGDLKNIYVADSPVRCSDDGVAIRPLPELGEGWFLAKVILNPATLHLFSSLKRCCDENDTPWLTHDRDGNVVRGFNSGTSGDQPTFAHEGLAAYIARPWTTVGGTPRPDGPTSSLRVAAVTLEKAGIDLFLTGNGLGNVYCLSEERSGVSPPVGETEPAATANPATGDATAMSLSATLRNMTDDTVSVTVTKELHPFERTPAIAQQVVELAAHEKITFDALAAPVDERAHYRVRVVADAGNAGRIDYRTNVALLAPDTRRKVNSPFGCWSRLWEDRATDEQRAYLKEKAGIDFLMGEHHRDHRIKTEVPDDAAAKIAESIGPDVRVFMLGWEHTWSMEQTFAFPRVIAAGAPEELPDDISAKADKTAAEFKRLAKAVREHRPEVKISLGNSAVNFAVPLLERGFKHGEHFDYFGTEEGLFDAPPEMPADAIGNVSWWARAVCEHFGFKNVPLFHSESVYYSTGPGFTRMDARTQAANYVRMYLLGYPYDSLFGLAGAMIDSSNRYIYSIWGMSGYCNQAPECSPKPSYVAFATLTQLLDGATYDGKLDTGATSVYALRFKQHDGSPLYAIWNLRGKRRILATVATGGHVRVVDAMNRPVDVAAVDDQLILEVSDLPLYICGVDIQKITLSENIASELPKHVLLTAMTNLSNWQVDAKPEKDFEAPRKWRGMPSVRGNFDIAYAPDLSPPNTDTSGAVTFTLNPRSDKHGLIPRYVSLTVKGSHEISIPAGTTRLGVWVRGNSTWANIKFGLKNAQEKTWLEHDIDASGRLSDNFDGWRFLQTDYLGADVQRGRCRLHRLVVTMPGQQVYVDDLITTSKPQIAIGGIYAIDSKPPGVNYLPW